MGSRFPAERETAARETQQFAIEKNPCSMAGATKELGKNKTSKRDTKPMQRGAETTGRRRNGCRSPKTEPHSGVEAAVIRLASFSLPWPSGQVRPYEPVPGFVALTGVLFSPCRPLSQPTSVRVLSNKTILGGQPR
jgi:hypothetical protein